MEDNKSNNLQSWIDVLKKRTAGLLVKAIDKISLRGINEFDIDRKGSFLEQFFLDAIGYLYYFYRQSLERLRVWLFKERRKIAELRILIEVFWHSRGLIFLLILLSAFSFPLYFLLADGVLEPTKDGLANILIAYSGGLSVLLGIIFALYSVGFQITTEKFSTDVTDYLNREEVGRFIFRLLAFSVLFSLINLGVQNSATQPLPVPFFISSFLVMASLLGVLIFKDDYITKLKPKEVFRRLYRESLEAMRIVNSYDCPEVKSFKLYRDDNVRSLAWYLPIQKSWSIVGYAQKRVDERLGIHETFYRDLIRDSKYEDAAFGIRSFGYLLVEYIAIKHFIDTKFGWWFPNYQEVVKADKPEMIPLKLSYESMGIGKLATTKKNYTWIEDKVLSFLRRVQQETDFNKTPLLGNALVDAYEVMLAGKYSKTKRGYEKDLPGIFEIQDFNLTEKVFELFVDLGKRLSTVEQCRGNFINAFGRVKTTFIDGFSKRPFPGKLENWKPELRKNLASLIDGKNLVIKEEDVVSWKLPSYFHLTLVDIQKKLEVEQQVEGRVVTPKKWFVRQAMDGVKKKEVEVLDSYRELLISSILELSGNGAGGFYKSHFGGILLALFNQLISQDRWQELEALLKKHKNKILSHLLGVDRNVFLDSELQEQIDYGTFRSLVSRRKASYVFYLRLFSLAQVYLSYQLDQKDNQAILKTVRRPLMLGGLAYLVSELDQDFNYVKLFTSFAEGLYTKITLADLYENVIEVKRKSGFTYFGVGYGEANRYRGYYRQVINSISELPKDHTASGSALYGLSPTETVKHSSQFIRKMAALTFSDMDECLDGYVEWLKRREEVTKLTAMLKERIKHAKQQKPTK